MSGRLLLVMALEGEGQGKLEALGHEVLYCGVGKVNASYRLAKMLAQGGISGVLNLGSAGSAVFPRGELVEATSYMQRDIDATGLGFALGETPFDEAPKEIVFPQVFNHLKTGRCSSGDGFLQGLCPVQGELIDMEAYALAKVCWHEQLPFASVKYITDGADDTAHCDWQENLRHAAQAFANLLTNYDASFVLEKMRASQTG